MLKKTVMAFAGLALLSACGGGDAADRPSVKAFMKDEVQPTADVFWKSSGTISDETGVHDLTPTTEEAWKKAADATDKLIEYGELMQTEPYAKDRGEAWIKFSKGLVEMAGKAKQSVADRDSDKMFEIGAYLYDVCAACHQAYPQTEGVEEGQEAAE